LFDCFDDGYVLTVSLIVFLILVLIVGLFVGALARLLHPGPDPMGIVGTILLGLAGSFIAGLFSWYVLHRHGAGLILSVVFSVLLLWIRRRSDARNGRSPLGGRARQ
jgi:uncharacterized membrane protein YeaQ/YmgE (transglycosylase-associated protein family)